MTDVRWVDTLRVPAAEEAARLFEENERLRCDFLSNASHELRTPLATIIGYAELLEDHLGGPLTPEQEAFVSQIQLGARRLETLFSAMLDRAGAVRPSLRGSIAAPGPAA